MKHILCLIFTLFVGLAYAQNNMVVPNDVPGRNSTMIRPAPTYVQARVLAAAVAETITLPAGTRLVIFSANCDFYAAQSGATATVPAADITDGTSSELNPAAYYYTNATTATQNVSVITAAASCIITASAYKGSLQ